MNTRRLGVAIVLVMALVACFAAADRLSARQIYPLPLQSPEQLRFQLIGNEQIAGPDGRTVVNGWSVLVFKDRKEARCYVAFKQGDSISAMEASACPAP